MMDVVDDFEYHLKLPSSSSLCINDTSSEEEGEEDHPGEGPGPSSGFPLKQEETPTADDGSFLGTTERRDRGEEEEEDDEENNSQEWSVGVVRRRKCEEGSSFPISSSCSSPSLLLHEKQERRRRSRKEGTSSSSSCSSSSPSPKKEPVVILLGWLGCSNKNLSKYSEIYEAKGCVTISYIASPGILFFKPAKCQENAQKLLNLLIDFSYEENPIFFHMFSNGGSSIYRYICDLLLTEEFRHLKIQGCIYDSAPGKPRPYQAVKAILISMQTKNFFFKYVIAISLYLYLFFVTNFKAFLSLFKQKARNIYEYLKTEESSKCPQLFLFSTADDIIFSRDIKEFVKYRQEVFGVNVKMVQWTDSSHVKHLLQNREAYISSCHSFLDMCLLDNR